MWANRYSVIRTRGSFVPYYVQFGNRLSELPFISLLWIYSEFSKTIKEEENWLF